MFPEDVDSFCHARVLVRKKRPDVVIDEVSQGAEGKDIHLLKVMVEDIHKDIIHDLRSIRIDIDNLKTLLIHEIQSVQIHLKMYKEELEKLDKANLLMNVMRKENALKNERKMQELFDFLRVSRLGQDKGKDDPKI